MEKLPLQPQLKKQKTTLKSSSAPTYRGKWYVVKGGKEGKNGLFTTWAATEQLSKGVAGCFFQKVDSREEAEKLLEGHEIHIIETLMDERAPTTLSFQDKAEVSSAAVAPTAKTSKTATKYVLGPRQKNPPPPPPPLSTWIRDAPKGTDVGPERLHAWCDGSSMDNGKEDSASGYGVWFGPGDGRNQSVTTPPGSTNNVCELLGAIHAFTLLDDKTKPSTLFTDSTYVRNALLDWIPTKWLVKGITWETLQKKNVPLFKILWTEYQKFSDIQIVWVKAHESNVGNVQADYLAGLASGLYPKRIEYPLG